MKEFKNKQDVSIFVTETEYNKTDGKWYYKLEGEAMCDEMHQMDNSYQITIIEDDLPVVYRLI